MKRIYLTILMGFIAMLSISEGVAQKSRSIAFDKRVVFHLPEYPRNEIALFPNPTNAKLHVGSSRQLIGFDLEIFDQTGLNCLKQASWKGEAIDVSKLQNGIYIVRFTRGKLHYAEKLIVQKE
ncbi:T9SS type A sorting domain-containing protein [Dyadobacter sp. CY347]|uniref:T9SS type A sorting domain-containing protein n=1 Tax=Dyadobacter sp. CY347 TaxID=2909336 RepID=UPI001F2F88B1|nr:T9SS type A sorting domain-containing protein [Dyadobacter sp. CY347]MCF2491201.1 T9SS type A sorting domain-containing protein [Dyadobacter sp. CY347]